MDLHRTGQVPEWEQTAPDEWNIAQKIAAHTHGIVTPGNAVTLAGTALTAYGLYQMTQDRIGRGAAFVTGGRLADLADGWLAHATKTKSPLGEAFDAGSDKLQTAGALGVALYADVMPTPLIGMIATEQIAIFGVSAVAKKRDRVIHPEVSGKFAMAAVWASFGAFAAGVIAEKVHNHSLSEGGRNAGYGTALLSVVLAGKALHSYARSAFKK